MNSSEAKHVLDRAHNSGVLETAVVVGKDKDGKVQLFLDDADREKLIVLLERAKNSLVRSLE